MKAKKPPFGKKAPGKSKAGPDEHIMPMTGKPMKNKLMPGMKYNSGGKVKGKC